MKSLNLQIRGQALIEALISLSLFLTVLVFGMNTLIMQIKSIAEEKNIFELQVRRIYIK